MSAHGKSILAKERVMVAGLCLILLLNNRRKKHFATIVQLAKTTVSLQHGNSHSQKPVFHIV